MENHLEEYIYIYIYIKVKRVNPEGNVKGCDLLECP
jgi:hypothetical protein